MRSCWGSEISGAGSSRSWTAPPYASMPAPLTCSTSCPGSAARHRAFASLLPHIFPANSSGGSSPPFTSRPVNNGLDVCLRLLVHRVHAIVLGGLPEQLLHD